MLRLRLSNDDDDDDTDFGSFVTEAASSAALPAAENLTPLADATVNATSTSIDQSSSNCG